MASNRNVAVREHVEKINDDRAELKQIVGREQRHIYVYVYNFRERDSGADSDGMQAPTTSAAV